NGMWESNTEIRAFAEQQQLTLANDLPVNISVPGTSPGATDSNLSGATIPAGTTINSYYLHFDVVGEISVNNAKEAIGSITFDEDILGLIVFPTALNNGTQLGLPGVTYATGDNHGLELGLNMQGTSDSVTLSADLRTVTVDLRDAS